LKRYGWLSALLLLLVGLLAPRRAIAGQTPAMVISYTVTESNGTMSVTYHVSDNELLGDGSVVFWNQNKKDDQYDDVYVIFREKKTNNERDDVFGNPLKLGHQAHKIHNRPNLWSGQPLEIKVDFCDVHSHSLDATPDRGGPTVVVDGDSDIELDPVAPHASAGSHNR
jgi:hypothetical protein